MEKKLTENMRRILAVLTLFGPQPTSSLIQIAYPGHRLWLRGQRNYFLSVLRRLEDEELIEPGRPSLDEPEIETWQVTEKGKKARYIC